VLIAASAHPPRFHNKIGYLPNRLDAPSVRREGAAGAGAGAETIMTAGRMSSLFLGRIANDGESTSPLGRRLSRAAIGWPRSRMKSCA
jgi:hypothetical protein